MLSYLTCLNWSRWLLCFAVVPTCVFTSSMAPAWAQEAVITEEVDESVPPDPPAPEDCPEAENKVVLGPVAKFTEKESGFSYRARVDTGAKTCSIHATKVKIEDANKKSMIKNIGKKVSFELESTDGKKKRVTTTIADTVRVKTTNSDAIQRRYKVWLTLSYGDVERRVHVTLNDRSHMKYPLLIGRNLLCGTFLVDVSVEPVAEQIADNEEVEIEDDEEEDESEG
ncbi:ATP-dependent zinc protease [Botrimarina mediterranea]|uniref:Retropepsin-like aspartic endopeptidase domain-containing protein n=1 Tax=Botrimarina mediterranea TaxID=2528022 RepID=A0A518KBK4_9BACT|nr:RimK/LysX family protein [Botrimarina mediterranea]QDV75158.1 hypothetical protein Spa11_33680 [Botrimarina mediterranea]QDV79804.1 hypothetical protein K2D_34200 [Planctomycetes bacterium K2D]